MFAYSPETKHDGRTVPIQIFGEGITETKKHNPVKGVRGLNFGDDGFLLC
jgi:hypothetical protein